ncbi:MAG: DUF1559 domain-containing protein [Planctomycetota bacterium]|nr:DUF1559 domain-containing protein [Planctomycetota bacterium]
MAKTGSLFMIFFSKPTTAFSLLLSVVLFALAGCGGSGSVSMAELRAAASTNMGEDDDEDEDDGSKKPLTAQPPAERTRPGQRPTTPPETPAAKTEEKPEDEGPVAPPPIAPKANSDAADAIAGILPIAQRKPTDAWSLEKRRKRSIDNMKRINHAIYKWLEDKSQVPQSVIVDATRQKGLSWRVAILPLLGYKELYKKFNLKEPWDSPTNEALLKYIPPEFVSPEHFDENTNYQMFVNGTALFSEKERKDKSDISDGKYVVVMGEVDRKFAVPWTSPYDYDVSEEPLTRGLGNERQDGTFVGWLTGRPSLWPNPINVTELKKALTFEAGDRFNIAQYTAYPPSLPGGDGRPNISGGGTVASLGAPTGPTRSIPLTDNSVQRNLPPVQIGTTNANISRVPMPVREEIIAAEAKMRATYEDAFKAARTKIELAKLAKTIHSQLLTSRTRVAGTSSTSDPDDSDDGNSGAGGVSVGVSNLPPAELFVGLRSAFRLAIRGADANLSLQLLNELENRFVLDLDEYESEMFDGLLGKKGSLRLELNKASVLIPILENLVLQNIVEDDYRRADKNLGYGLAAVRHMNDRETNYKWKVMRERVEEGKKRFPRVAKHISTLESDPENPEANLAVGWYFCIVKENWAKGASMLAKSKDRELRALALLEIQQDANFGRHVTLGDGWWDYGQKQKDETLVFEATMKRARFWYLSASENLPDGLDRIRANNRLDNIDRMIGRSANPQDQAIRGSRTF